jgi:hypothetical protein
MAAEDARQHNHYVTDEFNESALLLRPNGEFWCISRTRLTDDHSLFYWSKAPYTEWEVANLGVMIHCPVFCEVDSTVVVAGRRDPKKPWIAQYPPAGNTGLFTVERGKVTPLLALPSDGDGAYPGLVALDNGHLLVSYYSQHAYLSGAIQAEKFDHPYLAQWRGGRTVANAAAYSGPSDIFMAEIDLQANYDRRVL